MRSVGIRAADFENPEEPACSDGIVFFISILWAVIMVFQCVIINNNLLMTYLTKQCLLNGNIKKNEN
jgi:hypothetical protein